VSTVPPKLGMEGSVRSILPLTDDGWITPLAAGDIHTDRQAAKFDL